MASDNRQIRIIPMNVVSNKRIMGFRVRNIIEGAIMALLVILIIYPIPFVTRIKIIFDFIIGTTVFILCCMGFKDKAPSELLIDTIKYINSPKRWSIRSIKYATKTSNENLKLSTVTTEQSLADKGLAFVKEKVAEFKNEGKITFRRDN